VNRRVAVLGSTGSIGLNTLKVIEAHPEHYSVCALAAGASWQTLLTQARRHPGALLYLADGRARQACAAALPPSWQHRFIPEQKDAISALLRDSAPDVVVNAVSGAAGLKFTLAALEAGVTLALANKESLVMAGELVMTLAREKKVKIIPVDSEHAALAQLWPAADKKEIKNLWLTASGGPFLNYSRAQMADITPAMALSHPTWRMGPKISVDSATLMNKGLEVIEATHLFALDYKQVKVAVHPQSLVHGLIEMSDGAWLAQIGLADMRQPIAWALSYPERLPAAWPVLNLWEMGNLHFSPPDQERFPALRLALQAGEEGGSAPCLLNAANEVAVAAFIAGQLPFSGITACIEAVLNELPADKVSALEGIMAADGQARERARQWIKSKRSLSC
jgi:1-deoxy-D-xylulose-5-phosphate reductoisomerase